MSFLKYQHLERFGTVSVEGIENGMCHIFPKIDGTNASVWLEDGNIKAGSRNRELTLDNDNSGFYNYIIKQQNIIEFLNKFTGIRLYGEFLVPHTLKTYRDDAWKKFYVFDVCGNYEDDALELESIYQRKKKKAEETEAKKKELDEINSLLDKLESFNLYTRKIICLK